MTSVTLSPLTFGVILSLSKDDTRAQDWPVEGLECPVIITGDAPGRKPDNDELLIHTQESTSNVYCFARPGRRQAQLLQ